MSYEPKIVGFLCNWCAYTGADQAGASRQGYPQTVMAIRVMCTGRVDPSFVLEAFAQGADGVLICGCHPGDCHYVSGNEKAAVRHALLRRTLDSFGIEPERCRLEWVSASEGQRFADLVVEMTEQLRALGPLNLRQEAWHGE
jgi:coenzyme F420-reducing hydrogenase delta subunit